MTCAYFRPDHCLVERLGENSGGDQSAMHSNALKEHKKNEGMIEDELRSCTKQRTCPMGIERFHVHRPIPSRAHDLCEPLGIVSVGLVHLHLECGTGMSRIEANNVEPSLAQFMHKPRRHRAGFNP